MKLVSVNDPFLIVRVYTGTRYYVAEGPLLKPLTDVAITAYLYRVDLAAHEGPPVTLATSVALAASVRFTHVCLGSQYSQY